MILMNVHILHQTFQEWAKALPISLQQRLSCELLGSLAQCLTNDSTIIEIVSSLMDIQDLVEKSLYESREKLKKKHKEARINLCKDDSWSTRQTARKAMEVRHTEEMLACDKNIVEQLDAKVTEQQYSLEQAGVPGFKVTKDVIETKVQMCLIDFIIRSTEVAYK